MRITSIARYLSQGKAVKLLRLWMRTRNWLQYGDAHFPQQVFIEINTHCNRTCPYCPNVSAPSTERFMGEEDFVKVMSRLSEIRWRGPVAYHCLSEPLLHPNLVQFVRTTDATGMVPILFTNGDFMTMAIASELVDAGLARCTFAKHAPFKEGWQERIDAICDRYPSVFRHYKPGAGKLMKSGTYTKLKQKQEKNCISPELNLSIRVNGDIGLCHCDPQNLHSFGNVFKNGIMELWREPVWTEVRTRLRQGFRDFEICKACDGLT